MGISLNPSTLLNGTGVDVTSVVNQLIGQKSGELQVWQNQLTDLSTQAGLLSGINNNLTNLQTAVQALTDVAGPMAAQAATSSDSSLVTASAAASASAGTHQIVVTNLASNGTIYSKPIANADTSILSSGTSGDVQLQVGGSSGTVRDIAITKGSNDTLSTLANYINKQNWGVTANVVTDASGARLAMYSQSTGSAGALAVTSNTTSLGFETPSGGTNAAFTVDGVSFSSQSNTVSGVIAGVTLNFANADPNTTVQLTVGPDTSQATQAINNFVTAYNAVIQSINQQFTVDPTTNNEGPLGSDSSLRSLQSSLLGDVTYAISGNNGFVNLASLGINMNDDGTLTVGTNAAGQSLSQVLFANPSAVVNFFQNSSLTGFANVFNKDLSNLTDATLGVLNAEIAQNKTEQQSIASDINNFEARLQAEQTQLTQALNQANASLQTYPALLGEVTTLLQNLLPSSSTTANSSTQAGG